VVAKRQKRIALFPQRGAIERRGREEVYNHQLVGGREGKYSHIKTNCEESGGEGRNRGGGVKI